MAAPPPFEHERRLLGDDLAQTFADWLGAQMNRKGIRSGRRLAAEAGLDEASVLDWAIGRRVPSADETSVLVRFFGADDAEAQALRDRSEALIPRRGATRRAIV